MSGRMARWAVELSEFSIQYKLHLVMKGQVLSDFLAEVPQQETKSDNFGWWTLNVDGASRLTGARPRLQLEALIEEIIKQAIRLNFPASNNEAEYEAIIVGDLPRNLRILRKNRHIGGGAGKQRI